jgi:hypothetical protein
MATVLGTQLLVAQMGAPRTDRAFNRKHEAWRTLADRYVTTRHPADLAALPLHEGRAPRLYALEMLTPEQYAAMQARRGAERVFFLVRVAVKAIRHPDGTETRPAAVKEGDVTLAPAEWVTTLQQHGGLLLAEELAMVIERRAVIGDLEPGEDEGTVADPLDRYALPPGVTPGP